MFLLKLFIEGDSVKSRNVKRIVVISILVSLCAVLNIIDTSISSITFLGSGVRLGIANIVILVCLRYFDFKTLLEITALKSLLVGLILGTFATFIIGFVGSLLSVIVMTLAYKFLPKAFSIVSVSFLGALAHATGQLITVMLYNKIPYQALIIPSINIYVFSVITGIAMGIISKGVYRYTEKSKVFKDI